MLFSSPSYLRNPDLKQWSKEIRGAVLPPQTTQQKQILSLRFHGEDRVQL